MMAHNIKTLHTWDTVYSADSVEWCPTFPYQHLFVCGTYQLSENPDQQNASANLETALAEDQDSEKSQIKLGRLYLLAVQNTSALLHLQTVDMAAILDTKWCHHKVEGRVLLGVATAKGEIQIYELRERDNEGKGGVRCRLFLLVKFSLDFEDCRKVLALSLDWSSSRYDRGDVASKPLITVSDSAGYIHVLSINGVQLKAVACMKAHEYEAWITAFDYWNTSVIYSGGDDCKLLVFDLKADHTQPVLVNKLHEMGVTSIHSNEGREHMLVTGSYDEKLRVWDTRNMKKTVTSLSLTGGIWRLKWDPNNFENLLAACMHGGFCVIRAAKHLQYPQIIDVYKEHSSLAYGSDWCYLSDSETKSLLRNISLEKPFNSMSLIATCSFYDHKLCLSVVDKLPDTFKDEN